MANTYLTELWGNQSVVVFSGTKTSPMNNEYAENLPVSGEDDEILDNYNSSYPSHSEVQKMMDLAKLR